MSEVKRIRTEGDTAMIEMTGGSHRVKLSKGYTASFHRHEIYAAAWRLGIDAADLDAAEWV